MAISFSRPDPSSPAAVSDAAFNTSRRGFDQNEVRDFLRMVGAELGRLQERERFLERELKAAQSTSASSNAAIIDDETATRMLGEETARILQTAREAASAVKVKAEESTSRLLREAADDARRQREEAELESVRRRTDAAADAEAELAMAKQQGREMVEEARAYRERVLGELSRRRELARQQIEHLVHGRDRLLQAFERARLVVVDVVAEMTPIDDPGEYVDLSPTTGPVPIMVPAGNLGDASSIDDSVLLADRHNDPLPDADDDIDTFMFDQDADASAPSTGTPWTGLTVVAERETEPVAEPSEQLDATIVAFPPSDPMATVDDEGTAPAVDVELAEPGAEEIDVDDDDVTATDVELAEPQAEEIDDDDVTATDVDDLFARLRATPVEPVDTDPVDDARPWDVGDDPGGPGELAADGAHAAAGAGAGADELEDESPFRRRDAALVPMIVASARKLKRALADEQNEVLDTLRRKEPVRDVSVLVSSEQTNRYAQAITAELIAAAEAGASSLSGRPDVDLGPTGPLESVRDALGANLVAPLRERLERAVVEGDGDNDAVSKRVRSAYREWKTHRIDEQLDDLFRLAHARGAVGSLAPGTLVRWIVDPDGPPSPDGEDNVLAGPMVIGEVFPSGHQWPPMHPGCRGLLVLVDR